MTTTATPPDDGGESAARIVAQALNDYDETIWILRNTLIWLDRNRGDLDEKRQALIAGIRCELDKLENRQKTYRDLVESSGLYVKR